MKSDDVLRAAVLLFARQGYAATGIREIAREVGLNSATLYHYADGKEGLLVAVMRSCLDELLRSADEALGHSDDPQVQLGRLIRAHVGLSALNPLSSRVTDQAFRSLGPANRASLLVLRDSYESQLGAVIDAGARAGLFDVADPWLTRLAILEMCNGVANWYRQAGRLPMRAVQMQFVDFGCRLVGAPAMDEAQLGPVQTPHLLLCEPFTSPDTMETRLEHR